MITLLVALSWLVWPGYVRSDEWTKEDTKWQLVSTALQIIDAGQTADIRNHDDIHEAMPLTREVIGKNPSRTETALFFTGMIGLNYGIARMLPAPYRRYYQGARIMFNTGLIAHNYSIGLRWGF